MSLTSYVFHFSEDDSVKRLPMARWNRISDNQERFIGFENQIIRIAYAYIELHQRKPLYCQRIEGSKYRINQKGLLDQHYTFKNLVSPLDTLMTTADKETSNVISAEVYFRLRRYRNCCTWTPSPEDINKMIALIWRQ